MGEQFWEKVLLAAKRILFYELVAPLIFPSKSIRTCPIHFPSNFEKNQEFDS